MRPPTHTHTKSSGAEQNFSVVREAARSRVLFSGGPFSSVGSSNRGSRSKPHLVPGGSSGWPLYSQTVRYRPNRVRSSAKHPNFSCSLRQDVREQKSDSVRCFNNDARVFPRFQRVFRVIPCGESLSSSDRPRAAESVRILSACVKAALGSPGSFRCVHTK